MADSLMLLSVGGAASGAAGVLLDESGGDLLDESGNQLLEE